MPEPPHIPISNFLYLGGLNASRYTDPATGKEYRAVSIADCLRYAHKLLTERDAQWAQVTPHAENERAELQRLRALVNTPQTAEWTQAVDLEAAHQQERWGSDHDAGKAPEDWFWLLGYLGGKAVHALKAGNQDKGLHHIVSTSAALLNWHRSVTGQSTRMRPGIDPVARQVEQRERE